MFKKLKYKIQRIAIKCSLKRNPRQVIVMIDGGICSQIHQWRIGAALRARGVDVEYDIQWFKTSGKDINGKFVRNFDLLRAFPNLEFRVASDAKNIFHTTKIQTGHSLVQEHQNILDIIIRLIIKIYCHLNILLTKQCWMITTKMSPDK